MCQAKPGPRCKDSLNERFESKRDYAVNLIKNHSEGDDPTKIVEAVREAEIAMTQVVKPKDPVTLETYQHVNEVSNLYRKMQSDITHSYRQWANTLGVHEEGEVSEAIDQYAKDEDVFATRAAYVSVERDDISEQYRQEEKLALDFSIEAEKLRENPKSVIISHMRGQWEKEGVGKSVIEERLTKLEKYPEEIEHQEDVAGYLRTGASTGAWSKPDYANKVQECEKSFRMYRDSKKNTGAVSAITQALKSVYRSHRFELAEYSGVLNRRRFAN